MILKATCLSHGFLLIALLNFYSLCFYFFCKFSVNTPCSSMQFLFLPMSFIFYLLSKGLQVTYSKRQRWCQNVNVRTQGMLHMCCGNTAASQPFPPSSHLVLTRHLRSLGSHNSPYTDLETEGPQGRSWCRSSSRTAAATSCTVHATGPARVFSK